MNLNYAVRCDNHEEYVFIKAWLIEHKFMTRRKGEPQEIYPIDWYECVSEGGAHFVVNFRLGITTYCGFNVPEGIQIITGKQFITLLYNNEIKAIVKEGWS